MQKGHNDVCVRSGDFRLTFDHAPASRKLHFFLLIVHNHARCCHMVSKFKKYFYSSFCDKLLLNIFNTLEN